MKTTIDRFWEKVDKQENGCWLWTGCLSDSGYGRSYAWSHHIYAHRFSYEIHRGPIPPWTPSGPQIDHLICSNPACVNPEHMRLVTAKENILRSENPAAVNARKSHCIYGHEFTTENTYKFERHRNCKTCNLAWQKRKRME